MRHKPFIESNFLEDLAFEGGNLIVFDEFMLRESGIA